MPIATSCPECEAKFRLADQMAGKKVKCPKCGHILTVPKPDANESPSAPVEAIKPGSPSIPNGDATVAEDAVTTTPKKKAPPKRGDDEDEDDEPRGNRRSGPDKSRRDERPKAKSGMSGTVMALIGVGLFSCLCCGAAGPAAYFMLEMKPGPPMKPNVPIVAMNKEVKDLPFKLDKNDEVKDRPIFDAFKEKDKLDRPNFDAIKDKDGFKDQKNPVPAAVINVTFAADGSFRSDNFLSQKDAFGIMAKPQKTYFAQFEAGFQYQIDMMSPEFDTYLYLLDNNNKLLIQDDDGGDGLNSRIEFRPTQTGQYRIEAAALGIGQGKFTFTVKRMGAAPVPKVDLAPIPSVGLNQPLVVKTTKSGSFEVKELNKPFQISSLASHDPCWDADGKYFYWIQSGSTILKINQRELKVEATLNSRNSCHHLAMSAEGLLTIANNPSELWIIDPATMAVRKKISVPGASWVAASPKQSSAVVLAPNLAIVDLISGKVNQAPVDKAPPGFTQQRELALTPDGKYLFTQTTNGFNRIRVTGNQLVYDGAKPAIGKTQFHFSVSPDSKHVAILYAGASSITAKKIIDTDIYAVENLNAPAYSLPTRMRDLAFDNTGGIYGFTDKGELRYYPNPAKQSDQFETVPLQAPIRRMFAPPQGRGLLVASANFQSLWFEPVAK